MECKNLGDHFWEGRKLFICKSVILCDPAFKYGHDKNSLLRFVEFWSYVLVHIPDMASGNTGTQQDPHDPSHMASVTIPSLSNCTGTQKVPSTPKGAIMQWSTSKATVQLLNLQWPQSSSGNKQQDPHDPSQMVSVATTSLSNCTGTLKVLRTPKGGIMLRGTSKTTVQLLQFAVAREFLWK